jgi:hypothetical protein
MPGQRLKAEEPALSMEIIRKPCDGDMHDMIVNGTANIAPACVLLRGGRDQGLGMSALQTAGGQTSAR